MLRLNEKRAIQATLQSGTLANGDAANYYFSTPVMVCLLGNFGASDPLLYVRVNTDPTASPSSGEASATNFEWRMGLSQEFDLCQGGLRLIRNLSVFVSGTISAAEISVWGVPL